LTELKFVLAGFGNPAPERLFVRPEKTIEVELQSAELRSGRRLADLNGYYEFRVDPERIDELLLALNELAVVQLAYPAPIPVPPPGDINPPTPDFESMQGYLDPAPGGIDARHAWTVAGGRGNGVTLIDVEYDWNDTHEDLGSILGQELCFTPEGFFADHGTAVMGEVGGEDNGFGMTGVVPDATFGMVTQAPVGMSNSVARAINCAASLLSAGDVILLETQSAGPLGLLPSEWDLAEFDATLAATSAGILVVAAAGNGNVDLDDPLHGGLFDLSIRDSGAIIVGAGAAPGTGQPDRSKLDFSTYGSRVNVQGWGHVVATAGYGDLFDGGGLVDQLYTATFGGTSSASPIVTGAVVSLLGIQKARGGPPLDPKVMRTLLMETGSPQQAGPYPGEIGPRPDLLAAIAALPDLYATDVVVADDLPLGNDNGVLEPGETATLRVVVKNFASQTATNLSGALSASAGDVVVSDPSADWSDLVSGASAESVPDHHRVTVDPTAQCGDALVFNASLVSDQLADDSSFELRVGQMGADAYPSGDVPRTIPDQDGSGVTSTVSVAESFTIDDILLTVDITHGNIAELSVIITSPSATSVVLHNRSGSGTIDLTTIYDGQTLPDGPGTMDDFDGANAQGVWSLRVIDAMGSAVPAGTLHSWSLSFASSQCVPLSCGDLPPGSVGNTLILDKSGTADVLFGWSAVTGASGYRVWHAGDAGFGAGDVVGQTLVLTLTELDGQSAAPVLSFYQVRALNSCDWEGP
ncbi:MAG: S8 family serine peptidase, partial [Acidobacteriota bacterium]|nr:S8 family serine peptidase [Acidobacteriota bacterium]